MDWKIILIVVLAFVLITVMIYMRNEIDLGDWVMSVSVIAACISILTLYNRLRILEKTVKWLEKDVDELNSIISSIEGHLHTISSTPKPGMMPSGVMPSGGTPPDAGYTPEVSNDLQKLHSTILEQESFHGQDNNPLHQELPETQDVWENVDSNSLKSEDVRKLELLTKMSSDGQESSVGNLITSIPSEALSNETPAMNSEDLTKEMNDLDEPGINGDELMEHLLQIKTDNAVLEHDTAADGLQADLQSMLNKHIAAHNMEYASLDSTSVVQTDLFQQLSHEHTLDGLRNLCKHHGIASKGNKKELLQRLMKCDSFLRSLAVSHPETMGHNL